MKTWSITTFALCMLACTSATAQSATFQTLPFPQGETWTSFSLSADGKIIAADFGGELYRWTQADGYTDLGPGDPFATNIGISADGTAITASRAGADGFMNPSLWKQSTGWVDLGHPFNGCVIDGSWGGGWGLNADGTEVVGLAWYCPGDAEAFRWNQRRGVISMGHPTGDNSRATTISANGETIVGFWEYPRQGWRRAVRWTKGKNKPDLFTGVQTPGEATAVTSDGTQIVGQTWDDVNGHAFYFSDAKGLISLGTISHNLSDQSFANGISDTGVVVGWSGDPFGVGIKAFIWDTSHPRGHMQYLREKLKLAGAIIPNSVVLYTALAISADGSTIIGSWYDTQSFDQGTFIARLQ
jgi:uncharacterized membrane protein